jgi:cobalt-zinc-cadmium efflux system membrane fusion protein
MGLLSSNAFAYTGEPHDETENHSDHENGHEDDHHKESIINISEKMITHSGIKFAKADGGIITEYITTYGKVVPDPGHVSHVSARFEGLITNVKVNIGQIVKKGDVLATIEANQSLNVYPVLAPFDGMVTARHANPGELAEKQPLFAIADYSFMWVELKIFPLDMSKVKAKQKVEIKLGERLLETVIDHVVPNDDQHPFLLARVKIGNPDNTLSAGMMAKGKIIIAQKEVPLAVNVSALQILEEQNVLFVKTDSGIKSRQVTLGLADDQYVEIKQGLSVGDQYVSTNSYLIKADLLKSGAEHAH